MPLLPDNASEVSLICHFLTVGCFINLPAATYPHSYNPSYAIGACVLAIVFASTFSLIFPLIAPAVLVLLLLTLIGMSLFSFLECRK